MKAAKLELLQKHGTKCMLCKKDVGKKIQWHHIKPRCKGGLDTYENGALLCPNCHVEVHQHLYGDEEYTDYTNKILANKKGSLNWEPSKKLMQFLMQRHKYLYVFCVVYRETPTVKTA